MSLELALEWSEKGYAVIPVGKDRKPLLRKWTKDFAADPEAAKAMFAKRRSAQVGIVTGAPSKIIVVDLDNKEGQVAVDNLKALIDEGWPKTMMVQTQTGGFHLYYKDPGNIKTMSKWRPGIDTRAEGGQVVAPGSEGDQTQANYVGDYKLLTNGLDPQELPFDLVLKLPQKDGSVTRQASQQPGQPATQSSEPNLGLVVSGALFAPPAKLRAGERDSTIFRYAASLQAKGTDQAGAEKIVIGYYEEHCVDKGGFTVDDVKAKISQVYERYAQHVDEEGESAQLETPDPETMRVFNEAIFEAMERFIFVIPDGAYYDLWTGAWIKPAALGEAMRRVKAWMGKNKNDGTHVFENLWDRFKTNRAVRCVDGVVYKPAADIIVKTGRSSKLNMWTKPAMDPAAGDCSLFINHLREMVDGDEVSMTFIIDWMAHLVQFPGEKIGSTVLLSSTEEGLGKSLIGKVLQTILGFKNVAYVGAVHLNAAFNEWLEHSSLAIVEEFSMLGKWGTANKMKDLVTNDTVRINAKFRSEYTAVNHTNFLFFSNYPDAATLGSVNERRTFIHHTDITKDELAAKYQLSKEAYYGRLWEWARGDGPAHFAHFLLARDIQKFRAWGRFEPPATDSKRFAVAANLSNFEEWLEDNYQDRAGPFQRELTSKPLIRMAFEMSGDKWQDRFDHEIKRFIRARTTPSGMVRVEGKSVRVQAVEDPFKWQSANHGDRTHEYKAAIAATLGRQ